MGVSWLSERDHGKHPEHDGRTAVFAVRQGCSVPARSCNVCRRLGLKAGPEKQEGSGRSPGGAGTGVGVGAALGVAIGFALDHLALGLALGAALGAALDNSAHFRHKKH